jgi:hypothetical protein
MDTKLDPYMSFINYMNQGRIVAGRNLILKNNLKSLVMQKTTSGRMKVEHEIGDWFDLDNTDWVNSKMGYYGKDLSDSCVGSITLANLYGADTGDYIFSEEGEKTKKNGVSISDLEKEVRGKLKLKIDFSKVTFDA